LFIEYSKTTINAIEKEKKVIVITLDLFKAFNSVDHNLLLLKLFMIGCDLISKKWFKSYLSNRFEAVLHKGSISRFMSINLGVFQGSILGPLLFCIFINDLSRMDLKGEIVFFADDCSLILIGDSYQEVEECANHDLQLIEKWLKANRLILNVGKSSYLIINLNDRSINDLNIVICNERLVRVTKVKILGVFFDRS
jgi:hypothetical protein